MEDPASSATADNPSNSTMWYSILAFFLPVLLLLYYRHISRNKINLLPPPGPKPWHLIGNLNLIGQHLHVSLQSLSQKYGPLMQLKFGLETVVVGSSAEVAELLLKTHDVTFASRPPLLAWKHANYNYLVMPGAPYGPHWRQTRKIYMTQLLSPKSLAQFEYIRIEERKALLFKLYKSSTSSSSSSSTPVHLKERLFMFNLAIMSRMLFGKRYTEEDENNIVTPKQFTEIVDELFLLPGVLDIGDAIPWLAFLDLQGNIKRMKAVKKKIDKFYEHVLHEHERHGKRKLFKEHGTNDIVDVLLQLADDPTLEVKLERDHIKASMQDLLVGGIETSAVTLEWTMSELLKNPEVIQKATDELDRVIGRNKWVEEKDIVNLPYIQAIVKEVMRLHPPLTLLAPHKARENCKVAGSNILKNSRVIVNVWAIGRDPTLWEKPNEFCPERFVGKEIDVVGHNFELLPFGSGRRMCVGYALGLKIVQSTLANLLHGFEWKLPGDMKKEDLDMEERFGGRTSRKNPLLVVPKPRLPLDLYSL
ncbi:Flavonoid 3-monooxygenase [Citrus sinensis]|uniref:Flavonoid 3-monooxygenase n=2 Tax=Citrus sinensis TaxID=2711 RepID=A0ACB8LU32_CITSI|nr:Flavonoid 3-monooxygenase [Citrus sinensis]